MKSSTLLFYLSVLSICALGICACKQAPQTTSQIITTDPIQADVETLDAERVKVASVEKIPQTSIPIQKNVNRPICEDTISSRWTYEAYPENDHLVEIFIDPHTSRVFWIYKKALSYSQTQDLGLLPPAYVSEIVSEEGKRFSVKLGDRVFHIEKDHLFTQKGVASEKYFGGLLVSSKYKIEDERLYFVDSLMYMAEENAWDWRDSEFFLPAARGSSFSKKGDTTLEIDYRRLDMSIKADRPHIGSFTWIDLEKKDTTVLPMHVPTDTGIEWGDILGPDATYLLENEFLIYSRLTKDRFSYRLLSFDFEGKLKWVIPVDYLHVPFESRYPVDVLDDPANSQFIVYSRPRKADRKIFHTVGAIDKEDGSYRWKHQIDADTVWKSLPEAPSIKGHGVRVRQMFRIDKNSIGLIYGQLTTEAENNDSLLFRDGRLLILETSGKIICEQALIHPFLFIKARVKNGRVDIFSERGKWSLEIGK